MSKQHIFISYSRKDTDFVNRLAASLTAAGIPVWLDKTDLTPGTPNWEQAIRTAIDNAAAVVLVASPDSRASVYVHGELTLAKIRQRPVYPVWAAGKDWIDCIPLDMVNYQYIDCRSEAQDRGLQNIVSTLSPLIASTNFITIGLPTHETIEIKKEQFRQVQDFLNHLFLNYLQDWYQPLTYGQDWILGNVYTKQLAVPWNWLLTQNTDDAALIHLYRDWANFPFERFGLEDKSYWAVWDARRIRAAGIAVNDDTLVNRLLSPYSSRELWLLHDTEVLSLKHLDQVTPVEYKHTFVMALFGTAKNRIAFVQS